MSGPRSTEEDKETQVPEWEHEAGNKNANARRSQRSIKEAFLGKLDALVPPHRRYCGLSRKIFLWVLFAVVLALLALIIGLAGGLSKSK